MSKNIFALAAIGKYRFPSNRGDLMVENLFDLPLTSLPLTSTKGFDLDTVAKSVNAALKDVTEESFVTVADNPRKAERKAQLEAQLDIVKYVINLKQEEAKAAAARVAKAEERRKILDIINAKKDEALSASSMEELEKRLAALDS